MAVAVEVEEEEAEVWAGLEEGPLLAAVRVRRVSGDAVRSSAERQVPLRDPSILDRRQFPVSRTKPIVSRPQNPMTALLGIPPKSNGRRSFFGMAANQFVRHFPTEGAKCST